MVDWDKTAVENDNGQRKRLRKTLAPGLPAGTFRKKKKKKRRGGCEEEKGARGGGMGSSLGLEKRESNAS